MISCVIVTFSAFVRVCAFILQLLAFQASVVDPSPEIPATLPSSDEPSHLHTAIGLVMTIQLPYGISGNRAFFPPFAGPIQTAAPIPSVSVGVTNIRRLFIFESMPRYPPAPGLNDAFPQAEPFGYPPATQNEFAPIGLAGHTKGIPRVHMEVPQYIGMGIQVSAAKMGTPSSALSPSHTGVPSTTGSLPGASGAQLIGIARHHPHPNPQARPSARFLRVVSISCSAWGERPIDMTLPVGSEVVLTRDR